MISLIASESISVIGIVPSTFRGTKFPEVHDSAIHASVHWHHAMCVKE